MIKSLIGVECNCDDRPGTVTGVLRIGEQIKYLWVKFTDGTEKILPYKKVQL